jgi:hypothetical protein
MLRCDTPMPYREHIPGACPVSRLICSVGLHVATKYTSRLERMRVLEQVDIFVEPPPNTHKNCDGRLMSGDGGSPIPAAVLPF